jgi:hypothetical protein
LTGSLGALVQARTKGPGHGSESHAFYARANFVGRILQLDQKPKDEKKPAPDSQQKAARLGR